MERSKVVNSASPEEVSYFSQIGFELQGTERLILAGPDLVVHRFLNFLSEHFPHLHRKVARVESVEVPDDGVFAHYALELLAIA